MLNEFLIWWAQQLKASLPARLLQDDAGPTARGLVVALHWLPAGPPSVDVLARRKGRDAALGRFALDLAGTAALRAAVAGQGTAAVLRLPPELLLEQQVALPIAAERDPERVLHYEMDRITPFTADDLFWAWTVERRDRAQGRLHVRLSLVPKARVAPILDALRGAGLRPTALEAAPPGGPVRRVALDRPQPARWRRRGLAVAGAACAILAVAAVAVPFAVQSVRSAEVERRIAALRPQADEAEALRRRIVSSAAGTDVFAEQRARVGDALATLATLTDVLPDDTFLTELTVRTRIVTISGQSAGAARLIAALAAERGIRNPAFAAPVMRNEGTRAEGFSIRAEMAPEGAKAVPGVAPEAVR
jgi:general secretion pathway protein L